MATYRVLQHSRSQLQLVAPPLRLVENKVLHELARLDAEAHLRVSCASNSTLVSTAVGRYSLITQPVVAHIIHSPGS